MTLSKPSRLVHVTDSLRTTEILGMKRILDRYTASLLWKSETATLPSSSMKTLAVVGSTGFLGPYIVRTMSALQDIIGDTSLAHQRLEFLATDIASRDPNWGKPLGSFEFLLGALCKVINLLASYAGHPQITFILLVCAVGDWPLRHPDRPMILEEVIWDCNSAMPNGPDWRVDELKVLYMAAVGLALFRHSIVGKAWCVSEARLTFGLDPRGCACAKHS
ncbi:ochratoxin a non-ribosomal peptide synthetase [Pyrenophora seminiperda CCB06]|uniref:Ochratoxin a non-ribosomal peptide synthetase n=1 Tax=Pyrenophora seminiperda CCB06 TaxID=1302712 RepID=A0A3M7LVV4_9PLEO|nr:ochratoxin a non-ribosomal peptide synthetase [Pyrenophora seminiperda CCB06]